MVIFYNLICFDSFAKVIVADGEVAMKNLEAAQVKMEEKLNSLTTFIDQELQKARESPVTLD